MSISGQLLRIVQPPMGAALVATIALGRSATGHEHAHVGLHQIAWARTGVLRISIGPTTWVLPPSRALWIPADVPHRTSAPTPTSLQSIYLRRERCPDRWTEPTVLAVGPLLAALIDHLCTVDLGDAERARAEEVLLDQLAPAPVASVELVWPVDGRARAVADALAADPTDQRDTAALARMAGTSERTLTRLFQQETGFGPGRWRTRLRVRHALELLATGVPVGAVANRVGYGTSSAFVAAFRRELGATPAAIFGS
ncbi:AraC family transcriptional regulator [Pseudonocardia sp. TRM90224]|uniref:AraC family transcriptional regulator n=1 Tax=Pseudonocardia sp. TRM90224 TaxID=2812678 RepID=UPI001E4B6013|nr:helix-turn-helix transcriptional regulator [Pseudonocardia sp. TRM90224]